jgi:hypothetical protein
MANDPDFWLALPAMAMTLATFLFVYLLPTIIATTRQHRNAGPIIVINLFLRWTILGWIVALAWSVSANTAPKQTTD